MKRQKLIIFSIFSLLMVSITYMVISHAAYEIRVKKGEIQFECSTKENGTFIVDPEKIIGVNYDLTIVYFTNGYSTSCRVVD